MATLKRHFITAVRTFLSAIFTVLTIQVQSGQDINWSGTYLLALLIVGVNALLKVGWEEAILP